MPSRFACTLFLLLLLLLPASLPASGENLPPAVLASLKYHQLDPAHLSVFIQAVDERAPLLAHNDGVIRSPASIMKLLTTYAALDLLGPAYHWSTEVYVTGPIRDGRLKGNLVLRGGGDPGLSTERFWTLLREIRARGIREIAGDLVIDDTLFAIAEEQPGDFDRQPYRAYNVLPNAMLVNNNVAEFRIMRFPGKVGVYVDPPMRGFKIENRIGTRRGACAGFQRGVAFDLPKGFEGRHAVLSGSFPAGCEEYSLYRSVMPAPQFAEAVFRALWEELGGSIQGELRVAPTPPDATLLFAYSSLPLAEQVRQINKWSNNPMTRHLLLTMGLEYAGAPATPEKGRQALEAWADARGLLLPGLFVENGAGLSRRSRITAGGLGHVLLDAWRHPQMAELMSSMPISALDGTLRTRYHGAMAGRMYLKTGRLEEVASVAGLIHSRSGQRYVVVVIVNGPDAHRGVGVAIQDAILQWAFNR